MEGTQVQRIQGESFLRFCISWARSLEPFKISSHTPISELARLSSFEAPAEHKHFIFKGRLLIRTETLKEAGIIDGSVLHLVMNEQPWEGRPLFVRNTMGQLFRLDVLADFTVEDVKEQLASYQCMPTPEEIRLMFAGRLLQDKHTLREYNIQKPSVLQMLPAAHEGGLSTYVLSVEPGRGETDVSPASGVVVQFKHGGAGTDSGGGKAREGGGGALSGDGSASGERGGGRGEGLAPDAPVLAGLQAEDVELRVKFSARPEEGVLEVDEARRRVAFTPARPLRPAAHYSVAVNRRRALWQASGRERVQGTIKWDFFTAGYVPLRVCAVYPRPHSRVGPREAAVVVAFSQELFRGGDPADWLSVRSSEGAHPLLPPLYDVAARAVVWPPARPLPPNDMIRVKIRARNVCGARGESLLPLQADGLLKTSAFAWRFFTTHGRSEVSRYEFNNRESAGVAAVVASYQEGRLPLLFQPEPPA